MLSLPLERLSRVQSITIHEKIWGCGTIMIVASVPSVLISEFQLLVIIGRNADFCHFT